MEKYTTDGKVTHLSTEVDINTKLISILGDEFKKYREEWDKANTLNYVTDFPLFLQLDMNQECNFACPHCIIGREDVTKKYYSGKPIDWKKFKLIADEGAEHECPSISLQGNMEPLLIKDFEKYIEYCSKKGYKDIMINTNASAMTERRAKTILDAGLTRIRFSIDAATKDTFEKIRVGGRYKQVINNIHKFLEIKENNGYKLPITGVSFCRQKDNYKETDEFISYWKDRVDIVSIQKYMPPAPEPGYELFYPPDQLNDDSIENRGFKCPQPFQRITFRNTEMTPCCAAISSRLKLGEVGQDSIHSAWNSKPMQELRQLHAEGRWYDNPTCKTCVLMSDPKAVKDGSVAEFFGSLKD